MFPEWSSIADGVKLYKNGYVVHAGRAWLCVETHIKSAQDAPSYESPFSSPETANRIRLDTEKQKVVKSYDKV